MSRFKSIRNKINKKSSISVDEKLAALDKELEKTGMSNVSEMMTTDNVLSSSEYVPPQERIVSDVPNSSGIGGEGFTQSSAGSGTEGDPPNHSDMSDLYNSDVGHPIYSSTSYNGVSSFGIVIGPSFGAGTTYGIIEGGNTYRAILGGFLAGGTRGSANYKAIYDAKAAAPATYSQEQIDDAKEHWQLAVQVEAALIEIGYDNSRFNVPWKAWRSPILFEDLSGVPSFNHPTKGTIYLVTFNILGKVNRYTSQEPRPATTTNPQRRGLEDEPIYPGPIATLFGVGQRAFEWLRNKASGSLESAKETISNWKGLDGKGLTVGEKINWATERIKFANKLLNAVPAGNSAMQTFKSNNDPDHPHFGKHTPGHENFIGAKELEMTGDSRNKIQNNLNNGLSKIGVPKNFTGNLNSKQIEQLSNYMAQGEEQGTRNMDFYATFWSLPPNVTTVQVENGSVGLIKSNYLFTDEDDVSIGGVLTKWPMNKSAEKLAKYYEKNPEKKLTNNGAYNSNTYTKDPKKGTLQSDKLYSIDGGKTFKTMGAFSIDEFNILKLKNKKIISKPNPDAGKVDPSLNKIIGVTNPMEIQMNFNTSGKNLNTSTVKYVGRSGAKQRKLDLKNYKKPTTNESYITEGMGLGLYEPEAINVDLADIRKGVMPEYPKKPPAEMIDGYHEKSPLRPKPLDNEPFVKITRADLIRNHRLKREEADEMMDTINMINDHIKKHPEDLIHAQQRYPKDDLRLAELNWKMDQMLEAGEEYLDSNFKENKKLFKRATEHTLKNIKLTDPEYVQQKYDELRGTPKPKKTKLVGRLGKHLNKYESKSLFKHVNSKDFKKISERKLEKEKFLEKQEQERLDYINDINAEMDEFRSDWRNELKEQPAFKAVPVDTGKMTSSQSFAVFTNFGAGEDTGLRFSIDGGLGLDNSGGPNIFQYPTEAGGTVPAIDFSTPEGSGTAQISLSDFALSGYAMPLGGKMSRSINQKKSEEINKELESSEEFTKKIEADALMKARVDSNIMTGNNLQDITTSFENVKVPFDQGKFSSYMRTNIEQFQTLGAYEAEIEVLEHKIRKISYSHPIQIANRVATGDTEEARNKNYAKMKEFEKQIKQIKEKQRKIPDGPKYSKTKISQAQFDALLKEISPADYIEGEEILKNNFLGQLEKQKEELNKKFDSLVKKYPQFPYNGTPERIFGKWNGSVQIPIFDSDNNEIKPPEAAIGKQLEMIRLKKNIFDRMIYDSFDPSSVTYTMPPTVSDTSEPSPKEMKSSGDDLETMADIEKFAPEIIQQEINLDDVKSLENLPQNKVLETIAKLGRFQTGGLSLPFDLTIKYAMGDYTPVTKSPGAVFDNVTLTAIENAHIKYPGRNSVSPDNYVNMPSRFAQAAFQHFDYEVTPKGIRVKDDFNFKDPNKGGSTSIGAFAALDDYLPDKFKAQTIATNLVKIGDKRAEMLGYDPRDDNFGIPINYLIPYSKLSQKQKKLFYPERFRNENKRGSAFNKIKKIRNK